MTSSEILRHVAVVRTDVSEEEIASIIMVTIGKLEIKLAVTSNRSTLILVTLIMEVIQSSETPVLRRATRRRILEDSILHGHSRENLKHYII
jgi:hypothetical protein